MSRRAKNSYQASQLRTSGRKSPPSSFSLRKGEGKRRVILAAGPATSFDTFYWKPWFLDFLVCDSICSSCCMACRLVLESVNMASHGSLLYISRATCMAASSALMMVCVSS